MSTNVQGITDVNVDPPGLPNSTSSLLKLIYTQLGGIPGNPGTGLPVASSVGFLQAPPGTTQQVLTYYGSTNNVRTIVYSGGSENIQYNLAYVGGGVADNDRLNLVTITHL